MTGSPRLADYLRHILDAMARIDQYTAEIAVDDFASDLLRQDAVIRNIEVIGEASRRIQVGFPDLAASHPKLALSAAYQMRNAVAHGYFAVDLDIVWATIRTDLPVMAGQVRRILDDLDS